MRVEKIELYSLAIPFKQKFAHALKSRDLAELILVAITDERGNIGWGEIVPRPYLTGETIESVWSTSAPRWAARIAGLSFGSVDGLHEYLRAQLELAGRELAVWGGFELALLDLYARGAAVPLSELFAETLGPELPAGVVIGLEVAATDLPKHCAMLRMTGKTQVKVKVGADDDLERVRLIARAFGPAQKLRLDANATWSLDQAIEKLLALKVFNIASIEQPLAAADLAGARELRQRTGVLLMADESLCTFEDAERLIAEEAADIFNVRLGKCGGFWGTLRIVKRAQLSNISCHLGALVGETGVLSRAAEVFGRLVTGFECLEGKNQHRYLLVEDPTATVLHEGGLGIRVDRAKIEKYLLARTEIAKGTPCP